MHLVAVVIIAAVLRICLTSLGCQAENKGVHDLTRVVKKPVKELLPGIHLSNAHTHGSLWTVITLLLMTIVRVLFITKEHLFLHLFLASKDLLDPAAKSNEEAECQNGKNGIKLFLEGVQKGAPVPY